MLWLISRNSSPSSFQSLLLLRVILDRRKPASKQIVGQQTRSFVIVPGPLSTLLIQNELSKWPDSRILKLCNLMRLILISPLVVLFPLLVATLSAVF